MSLESHDLATALRALHDGQVATCALPLGGFETELVRVPAGMRYEHGSSSPATLLVLAGIGSVALDDWRTTLAGGHLLGLPSQARLLVSADAGVALELLLTRAAQAPTPST